MTPTRPARARFSPPSIALFGALLCAAAVPALADTYNVDISADTVQDPAITDHCAAQFNTSHCSLRAAIKVGNNRSGTHIININVPAITIINGDMEQMRAPFVVNGNHATINGNGHGCMDLTDAGTAAVGHSDGATGSKLFNLVIGNCSGAGISANGHNYVFSNNYIGVNSAGLAATPNTGNGIEISASHVYQDTSQNFLLNLYNSFPIQPVDASGINAFSNSLATALASLQPVLISGNVISGNTGNGIEIFSQNIAAVTVSGNMIGTDLTGNLAIGNGGDGIHFTGSSFGNLIGPGNVISANGGNGINVATGTVFLPNFIMGNRIGLSSSAPGVHLGNALSGITTDTKPDTSMASPNPSGISLVIGPANVIADNKGANNNNFPDTLGNDYGGIQITGTSNGVKVIGNTIGLAEFPIGKPSSSTAYGNKGDGIVVTSSGNSISNNTISANARHGILVKVSTTASTSITGNSIGVSPAFGGNLTLGNGVDGVHIDAASATNVGGPNSGDGNTIVANKRNGIKLLNGGGDQNGWSNLFQHNVVYGNAKTLGGVDIDLEHSNNATDVPDHSEFPNNYANRDQATPQICVGTEVSGICAAAGAPTSVGLHTTLKWWMLTHGPANFRVEFFAVNAATTTAATSFTFLGEQLVNTDANGKPTSATVNGIPSGATCASGKCSAVVNSVGVGRYIVMTATDVTPLTNTPAGGSDWKAQLKCFIGNNGIILPSCKTNDTSEYSNVVSAISDNYDNIFANGFGG